VAEHLSEFALEALLTGDAPPSQHLESCEPCRRRAETLRSSSEQLAGSAGYARTLAALGGVERRRSQGWRQPRWLWSLPAVAAAAALLLWVRVPSSGRFGSGLKGQPSIAVVLA
jgi:anti-sigma factor RsiW